MPAPRLRFLTAWIFVPPADRRVAVKYPAGWEGVVTRDCAAQALAAGAAVRVARKPSPPVGEGVSEADG